MTDFAATIIASQIQELAERLNTLGFASPGFVRLRRDSKRPFDKEWQKHPRSAEQAIKDLKHYDVGLIPGSIGMVVFDNDDGGQIFFDAIRKRFSSSVIAVTPSSSGKPGRGHAWVRINEPSDIGCAHIHFQGNKVGEFRGYNGQVRLTKASTERLLLGLEFFQPENDCAAFSNEIVEFAQSKLRIDQHSPTELGEDRGEELPAGLEGRLNDELHDSDDRSRTIARWIWKLRKHGYSPAEIIRFLSNEPVVDERIREKGYKLEQDVLKCCASFDANKKATIEADFCEELVDVFHDWVWIADRERFIRRSDRKALNEQQFSKLFRHLHPKGSLLIDIWENKTTIPKFESAVYLPLKPEFTGEQYNLWRPSGIEAQNGNTSILERHLQLLIPDETERNLLLDFLHFIVCKPDVKLKFAMVIRGEPGIGKSALGHLLKRVIGVENVRFPSNDEIASQWTAWQEGRSLIIVEELRLGQFDCVGRLKTVITEPKLRIQEKHMSHYTVPNVLNLIAFTNHFDAVKIDRSDRRWMILASPMARQKDSYYDRLFEWINRDEAPGAFLHFLQQRRPKLNPNGNAPMTDAKLAMIEATRPRYEQMLLQWKEERTGPFVGDLATFDEIQEELQSRRLTVSKIHLSEALKKLGAHQFERAKVKGFESRTLWAIRNVSHWCTKSHRERLQAHNGFAVADE